MRPWSVKTDQENSHGNVASKRIRWWLARILLRGAQVLSSDAIEYSPERRIDADFVEDVSPFEVGPPPAHWVDRVRRGAPELLTPPHEEIAIPTTGQASAQRDFDHGKAPAVESGQEFPDLHLVQESLPLSRFPAAIATAKNASVVPKRSFLFRRRSEASREFSEATATTAELPTQKIDSSHGREQSAEYHVATAPVRRGSDSSASRNVPFGDRREQQTPNASKLSTVGHTSQGSFEQRPNRKVVRTESAPADAVAERNHGGSREGNRGRTLSSLRGRTVSPFPSPPEEREQGAGQGSARMRAAAVASVSQVSSNVLRPVAATAGLPSVRALPSFAVEGSPRGPADTVVANAPLFAEDFDPWPELPGLQPYDRDAGSLRASEAERWVSVSGEQWGDR